MDNPNRRRINGYFANSVQTSDDLVRSATLSGECGGTATTDIQAARMTDRIPEITRRIDVWAPIHKATPQPSLPLVPNTETRRAVNEHIEAVAESIWKSTLADDYPGNRVWLDTPLWMQGDYRRIAKAAIDALGLTEEHQWVPIAKDGSRWAGRSEAEARRVFEMDPSIGGDYGDGFIVETITHETRLVGPWSEGGEG